jgi:hypothetical protein
MFFSRQELSKPPVSSAQLLPATCISAFANSHMAIFKRYFPSDENASWGAAQEGISRVYRRPPTLNGAGLSSDPPCSSLDSPS